MDTHKPWGYSISRPGTASSSSLRIDLSGTANASDRNEIQTQQQHDDGSASSTSANSITSTRKLTSKVHKQFGSFIVNPVAKSTTVEPPSPAAVPSPSPSSKSLSASSSVSGGEDSLSSPRRLLKPRVTKPPPAAPPQPKFVDHNAIWMANAAAAATASGSAAASVSSTANSTRSTTPTMLNGSSASVPATRTPTARIDLLPPTINVHPLSREAIFSGGGGERHDSESTTRATRKMTQQKQYALHAELLSLASAPLAHHRNNAAQAAASNPSSSSSSNSTAPIVPPSFISLPAQPPPGAYVNTPESLRELKRLAREIRNVGLPSVAGGSGGGGGGGGGSGVTMSQPNTSRTTDGITPSRAITTAADDSSLPTTTAASASISAANGGLTFHHVTPLLEWLSPLGSMTTEDENDGNSMNTNLLMMLSPSAKRSRMMEKAWRESKAFDRNNLARMHHLDKSGLGINVREKEKQQAKVNLTSTVSTSMNPKSAASCSLTLFRGHLASHPNAWPTHHNTNTTAYPSSAPTSVRTHHHHQHNNQQPQHLSRIPYQSVLTSYNRAEDIIRESSKLRTVGAPPSTSTNMNTASSLHHSPSQPPSSEYEIIRSDDADRKVWQEEERMRRRAVARQRRKEMYPPIAKEKGDGEKSQSVTTMVVVRTKSPQKNKNKEHEERKEQQQITRSIPLIPILAAPQPYTPHQTQSFKQQQPHSSSSSSYQLRHRVLTSFLVNDIPSHALYKAGLVNLEESRSKEWYAYEDEHDSERTKHVNDGSHYTTVTTQPSRHYDDSLPFPTRAGNRQGLASRERSVSPTRLSKSVLSARGRQHKLQAKEEDPIKSHSFKNKSHPAERSVSPVPSSRRMQKKQQQQQQQQLIPASVVIDHFPTSIPALMPADTTIENGTPKKKQHARGGSNNVADNTFITSMTSSHSRSSSNHDSLSHSHLHSHSRASSLAKLTPGGGGGGAHSRTTSSSVMVPSPLPSPTSIQTSDGFLSSLLAEILPEIQQQHQQRQQVVMEKEEAVVKSKEKSKSKQKQKQENETNDKDSDSSGSNSDDEHSPAQQFRAVVAAAISAAEDRRDADGAPVIAPAPISSQSSTAADGKEKEETSSVEATPPAVNTKSAPTEPPATVPLPPSEPDNFGFIGTAAEHAVASKLQGIHRFKSKRKLIATTGNNSETSSPAVTVPPTPKGSVGGKKDEEENKEHVIDAASKPVARLSLKVDSTSDASSSSSLLTIDTENSFAPTIAPLLSPSSKSLLNVLPSPTSASTSAASPRRFSLTPRSSPTSASGIPSPPTTSSARAAASVIEITRRRSVREEMRTTLLALDFTQFQSPKGSGTNTPKRGSSTTSGSSTGSSSRKDLDTDTVRVVDLAAATENMRRKEQRLKELGEKRQSINTVASGTSRASSVEALQEEKEEMLTATEQEEEKQHFDPVDISMYKKSSYNGGGEFSSHDASATISPLDSSPSIYSAAFDAIIPSGDITRAIPLHSQSSATSPHVLTNSSSTSSSVLPDAVLRASIQSILSSRAHTHLILNRLETEITNLTKSSSAVQDFSSPYALLQRRLPKLKKAMEKEKGEYEGRIRSVLAEVKKWQVQHEEEQLQSKHAHDHESHNIMPEQDATLALLHNDLCWLNTMDAMLT